jgi:hypothetical protein
MPAKSPSDRRERISILHVDRQHLVQTRPIRIPLPPPPLLLLQLVPMFRPLFQPLCHTKPLPSPVGCSGPLEVLHPVRRRFHLVVIGLLVLCQILGCDKV